MSSWFDRIVQGGIDPDDSLSYVFLCASVSFVGGLVFGYNTGVIAPALSQISQSFGDPYYLSTFLQGLVTCSTLLGAMIGSAFGASLIGLIGYKFSLFLTGLITVIGALVSASLPDLASMLVLRVFLGLGVGLSSVVCPAWVGEMSPPRRKGMLGAMFQLSLTFGILISYLVGLAVFFPLRTDPDQQWRILFAIGAVPGLGCLVVAVLMPEADSWLDKRDDQDQSQSSSLQAWRLLMCAPQNRRPFLMALLLAVTLQLTGINAFIYFAPSIFATAGVPPGSIGQGSLLVTTFVGLWNFLSTIVCAALVDRVGRKPLLVWGVFIMTASSLTQAVIYLFQQSIGVPSVGYFAVALTLIFILAFEASVGSLFWVILTELFVPEVQGVGLAFANLLQWSLNLILSAFFLPMEEALGQATVFFIFGFVGLVATLLFAFYLPETGGSKPVPISYEEIDDHQTRSHYSIDRRAYESAGEPSINY